VLIGYLLPGKAKLLGAIRLLAAAVNGLLFLLAIGYYAAAAVVNGVNKTDK
jgi:hypothetical protein